MHYFYHLIKVICQTKCHNYLENSNKNYSKKIAVIDEKGKYTYKELKEISKKIGTGLSKKIERRRPVPILMEKGSDALVTFFGTLYAGCV